MGTNTDPYQRAEGQLRPHARQSSRRCTTSRTPFSDPHQGHRAAPRPGGARRRAAAGRARRHRGLAGPARRGACTPRWSQARRGRGPGSTWCGPIRAAGLPCGVFVAPVLPHLTDSVEPSSTRCSVRSPRRGRPASAWSRCTCGRAPETWFLAWLASDPAGPRRPLRAALRPRAPTPTGAYRAVLSRRWSPADVRGHGLDAVAAPGTPPGRTRTPAFPTGAFPAHPNGSGAQERGTGRRPGPAVVALSESPTHKQACLLFPVVTPHTARVSTTATGEPPPSSTRPRAPSRPSARSRSGTARPRPTAAGSTRAKLMAAVVECLVEVGWAGTTTTLVSQRAGVSRGAQLHHFATRGELVAAAVEHLGRRGGGRGAPQRRPRRPHRPGHPHAGPSSSCWSPPTSGPIVRRRPRAVGCRAAPTPRCAPWWSRCRRASALQTHRMAVRAARASTRAVAGVRELVQATLDLARGLALADQLVDDQRSPGPHRRPVVDTSSTVPSGRPHDQSAGRARRPRRRGRRAGGDSSRRSPPEAWAHRDPRRQGWDVAHQVAHLAWTDDDVADWP